MVLPVRPWRKFHPWTCFPADLARNDTFLAVGTAWVLAWKKQLQMAAPLPGVSLANGIDQSDKGNFPNKTW